MIYNEENFPGLPNSWVAMTFDCSVHIASTANKKLKSKDVLDSGRFPVIDQGQRDISGYSDDESLIVIASKSNPVILFGDHTRLLKQIFQSFVPGADGTKLFRVRPFLDPRFAFQMMKAIKLPDKGYARHYQHLRNSLLPVPPLNEQKRIAYKLDTVLARVDACRERLDRVALILKRFRQSVLVSATSGKLTEVWRHAQYEKAAAAGISIETAANELTNYLLERRELEKNEPPPPDLSRWNSDLPETWVTCSVNQFAQCLDRFRVPIKRENRANVNGHYPYFGANGEVSRIDEFIFDDELVLVTEDETFYGREKPIAYRSSGKCWVNNHAHVLRPKTKIGAEYLCYALMYYDVIPWLSGTTGRAKLTQQALNAIPIALPPDREMIEIVRRVQTLFAFADRLEARLTTARTAADRLTPALLAKAFRGELVPQDPEDEPAAALLARLAASRAADGGKAGRSGKSAKRKAS